MFAIVCDKCGNTAVLENDKSRSNTYKETGFRRVCVDNPFESELDLCEECAKELLGLVRGEEADNA
jgi:hypothetical protein